MKPCPQLLVRSNSSRVAVSADRRRVRLLVAATVVAGAGIIAHLEVQGMLCWLAALGRPARIALLGLPFGLAAFLALSGRRIVADGLSRRLGLQRTWCGLAYWSRSFDFADVAQVSHARLSFRRTIDPTGNAILFWPKMLAALLATPFLHRFEMPDEGSDRTVTERVHGVELTPAGGEPIVFLVTWSSRDARLAAEALRTLLGAA